MKKLITVLLCFLILFNFTAFAAEEDGVNEQDEQDQINIILRVGEKEIIVNGNEIEVEAPFLQDGVTLVPVRVISEAFGAQVDWNSEKQLVTISYDGVVIELTIGNKIAFIGGTQVELLLAPQIINGVTMVPLRFIAENFGADVSFQEDTQIIHVEKVITGDADYSQLIQKTKKAKIGDSYHQWYINALKKVKIADKALSGKKISFVDYNDNFIVELYIETARTENLEIQKHDLINSYSDVLILEQGGITKDGTSFVRVVVNSGTTYIDHRVGVRNGKEYHLVTTVKNKDTYYKNEDYRLFIDSFTLGYLNDGSIEDLSELNAQGLKEYKDDDLKISLQLCPDWEKETTKRLNERSFYYSTDSLSSYFLEEFGITSNTLGTLNVRVTTREDGLTYDQWLSNKVSILKKEYSTDYLVDQSTKTLMVSGKSARVIEFRLYNADETSSVIQNMMILDDKYKYELLLNISDKFYRNKEFYDQIEKMFLSFKFDSLDASIFGSFVDTEMLYNDAMRDYHNRNDGWSIKVPRNWSIDEYWSWGVCEFIDNNFGKSLTVSIEEKSLQSALKDADEGIKEEAKNGEAGVVKTTLKAKGTEVTKYSYVLDWRPDREITVYILQHNGRVYTLYFSISKPFKSPGNIKLINDIWESFTFDV